MCKTNMSFVMCTIDQFLIQIARIMRVAGDHDRKSAVVVKPCETCIKSNTKIHRGTVIWGSALKTQQPLATGAVHPNMQHIFCLTYQKNADKWNLWLYFHLCRNVHLWMRRNVIYTTAWVIMDWKSKTKTLVSWELYFLIISMKHRSSINLQYIINILFR